MNLLLDWFCWVFCWFFGPVDELLYIQMTTPRINFYFF